jgi:hypothetical protein
VAAMNDAELESLIDDHYQGEAQTLTTGAEHNLLKLAELRGRQSPEQKARWDEVKRGFKRIQISGGKDDDPAVRVATTLSGIAEGLDALRGAVGQDRSGQITNEIRSLREAVTRGGLDPKSLAPIADSLGAIRTQLEKGSTGELRDALGTIALKLDALRTTAAQAGKATPAVAPPPLPIARPVLADNSETTQALQAVVEALRAVGQPQITLRVPPAAGIEELLGQQVALIERTLVPLVKATVDNLHDAQAIGRNIEELLDLLRKADRTQRG